MKTADHIVADAIMDMRDHKSCSLTAQAQLLKAFPIGTRWYHFRSTNLYVILGYCWNTVTDEWQVKYRRVKPSVSIEFTRDFSVFFAMVPHEGGEKPRFRQTADVP